MVKTDSKLSIEFNSQGGTEYVLKDRSDNTVADKADISRIQTMGSFITKERKQALGEEVTTGVKFTMAAFVQKAEEIGEPIGQFHKSFVATYRVVNQQYQTLGKNITAIESFRPVNTGGELIKNALIEFGRRASAAMGKYMFHRANLSENQTPEKLNAFLFREHVPIYVYTKMITPINVAVAGFDIRTVLFPKDPTKGLYLTFKEISNHEFKHDLMGIAQASELVYRLADDDVLIRAMTNLSDNADIRNFDTVGTVAAKMAGTPFYLLPPEGCVDIPDVINYLAKNGVRGVVWNSGSVQSPTEFLKFYGTVAKRMYYAFLVKPQQKVTLIQRMFPGFIYQQDLEDQRDIFVQLKAWSGTPNATPLWFTKVDTWERINAHRAIVNAVFNDVVAVQADHGIALRFAELTTEASYARIRKGVATAEAPLMNEVKNLSLELRSQRRDPDALIGGRITSGLSSKKKEAKTNKAGLSERSTVSPAAVRVLRKLTDRGFSAVAIKLRQWFRLFLDEKVQAAVADVLAARLDSFLDEPLVYTAEERRAIMDPDDPNDEIEDDEPDDNDDVEVNPDDN